MRNRELGQASGTGDALFSRCSYKEMGECISCGIIIFLHPHYLRVIVSGLLQVRACNLNFAPSILIPLNSAIAVYDEFPPASELYRFRARIRVPWPNPKAQCSSPYRYGATLIFPWGWFERIPLYVITL